MNGGYKDKMTINVLGEKIEVVQCTRCEIPTFITPNLVKSHRTWHRKRFLMALTEIADERFGPYRLRGQMKSRGRPKGWRKDGNHAPAYGSSRGFSDDLAYGDPSEIDEVLEG